MKKHFNIRVSGKVQGVFYRANTQREAIKLGLTGFVRNELNGNVYIEAEGDELQLKKLIDWCWKGPQKAVVENIHITETDLKNFSDFVIKR